MGEKMKKLILMFLATVFLTSCSVSALENENKQYKKADKHYYVSKIKYVKDTDIEATEYLKAIWVSQFDMHPIYRNGNKQRAKDDYTQKVQVLINNIKEDGFNTVFLQLRPNGDSMYESEYYPMSKYIAGIYGAGIEYDAINIFLEIAKQNNVSVHAWINPFRLCKEEELLNYQQGLIYQWYGEGLGKRIEIGADNLLYLDPAYKEATELICNGAKEILEKYDFDGIHLDDYFYPTEFEFDDNEEFLKSGYNNKGDFRRNNIDRTVTQLYEICHNQGKTFGISPAGNIYSLTDGWYIDIYKWCSNDGYIDYVIPQLYYGFENEYCPFDKVLKDWESAIKCKNIKLYIGLSAAKCVLGSQGIPDEYAGESGKFEWQDKKDILAKSLIEIYNNKTACGFCIFAYSSFYDPLTGEDNILCQQEKNAFWNILKEKDGIIV